MPKLSKSYDRGWRDWYQLQHWRNRRRHQLRIEPLCRMCLAAGRVTPATVADHITPHGGDWNAFRTGELRSLCIACHNKRHGAPRPVFGLDGWPIPPE
jgi:5-methylcytosine-specific restriction endonuclease McrA